MDRDRAVEIQRNALADWVAAMAQSSSEARLFQRDGVSAVAAPACPARSIANSTSFRSSERLFGALEELARFYTEAGIEAWTVWVPEFDQEAIAGLVAAGHEFDGKPMAMILDLTTFEAPDLGDLDWDAEADPEEFGRVNDAAYGYAAGAGYAAALAIRPDELGVYRARVDGETACVLGTIDHADGDLGVYFVATDPALHGRGLATRLMTAALLDARERGRVTSSLQASAMGEPVYRRLGYEPQFRLHLYERRR